MEKMLEYEPSEIEETESILEENDVETAILTEKDVFKKVLKDTKSQETTEDITADDLHLIKQKVEDCFSETCKKNTEKRVKAQVKANITIRYLTTEFQDKLKKRTSLEKICSESDIHLKYLQNQVHLEQSSRTLVKKEVNTIGVIVDALQQKLADCHDHLNKSNRRMVEYKNKAYEIANEYKTCDDTFQTEFAANNIRLQECKKEFEEKQDGRLKRHQKFLKEKKILEENCDKLRENLAIAKRDNEELLEMKEKRIRQLSEGEESVLKSRSELETISVKEAEETFKEREKENWDKINEKLLESEGLKLRFTIELDYLKELNVKLESLRSQSEDLSKVNDQLVQKLAENEAKHSELAKNVDESGITYAEEIETLTKNKRDIEEKIHEIKKSMGITLDCTSNVQGRLRVLKEDLNEASSIVSALNNTQNVLKEELDEQNLLQQTILSQKNSLVDTLTSLQEEISKLNEKALEKENNFTTLQSNAAVEIIEVEAEINNLKETEFAVNQTEADFENVKVDDEKRIETFKKSNEIELKALEDELKRVKDGEESLAANKKDLFEKVRSKTEKRDILHTQFKAFQEKINALEGDLRNSKVETPPVIINKPAISQKPASILKSNKMKSPQKKVTFDQNVNWETLSESSADAFFTGVLKPKTSTRVPQKGIDDLFEILKRNSPPQRDITTESVVD